MAPAISEGKQQSNFGLLLPIASLSEQLSIPLKCGFGQKAFLCVPSVLNVSVKRKLATHGIGQNYSSITGHLCDCSHQGNFLPVIQLLYKSCAGRHIDRSCIQRLCVVVILRSLNLAANVNPVWKIVLYFSVIHRFWFYYGPLRIQRRWKLLKASLQSGID